MGGRSTWQQREWVPDPVHLLVVSLTTARPSAWSRVKDRGCGSLRDSAKARSVQERGCCGIYEEIWDRDWDWAAIGRLERNQKGQLVGMQKKKSKVVQAE